MEPANPKASRWSDGPPDPCPVPAPHDSNSTAEKRPPPASAETPSKRSKLEPPHNGSGSFLESASFPAPVLAPTVTDPNSAPPSATIVQSFSISSGLPAGLGAVQSFASFAPGSAKGAGTAALFYKTKLCTKFKVGSCTFNERCHFAHGVEDLRKPPVGWEETLKQSAGTLSSGGQGGIGDLPKKNNKPCRYFFEGNCPYADRCTFSHGNDEPPMAPAPSTNPSVTPGISNGPPKPNYKTRLCTRWENGESCIYGDKCHFAHGQAELRTLTLTSSSNYASRPNYGTAAPATYSDPSIMNPPSLTTYAVTGVASMTAGNTNSYSMAGSMYGMMNSYSTVQDASNGYAPNYAYWNPDAMNSTVPVSVPPPVSQNPGYVQPNPQAPWIPNYPADGSYAKNEGGASYYAPDQLQLAQNVQYYGNMHGYQDSTQNVNLTYMQDTSHNHYQNELKNGDAGTYCMSNYSNSSQHPGYTGAYNTGHI